MFHRALIVIDHRALSQIALDHAVALGAAGLRQLVLAIHVPNPAPPMAPEVPYAPIEADALHATQARLDEAQHWLEARGFQVIPLLVRGGDAAEAMAEAAKRNRVDLIVVATEGRNAVVRLLTGSVVPGLITLSPVPVMVCKADGRPVSGRRQRVRALSAPLAPTSGPTAPPQASP